MISSSLGSIQIRVRMSVQGEARYSWTEMLSGLRHVKLSTIINVTRLLALSRYHMETCHLFDKISCWRFERCVSRNCFAYTCSLQGAWTEPQVPFGWLLIYQGLSGCKMKMDFWVVICQLQKQLLYSTNVRDFWGIHYPWWKWSHTDPTAPIYLLILVQLLEDQILCWASADALILFQAICQGVQIQSKKTETELWKSARTGRCKRACLSGGTSNR